jgi:glutamyl-tRNA reductase
MQSPFQIVTLGLNHRTAPVEFREKFAFAETEIGIFAQNLLKTGAVYEAVVVSTCNRVEIYFTTAKLDAALSSIFEELKKKSGIETDLSQYFYTHQYPASVQHLYEVSSGLDSMVVGETEILGQVKEFYRLAHSSQCTSVSLNKLFQSAFSVAKHIRSQTRIGMGSVSVGSVAADLASQIFGELKNRSVMLMGAGEMSEVTAKALQNRGAQSLMITNRSFERAENLAKSLNGLPIRWDAWIDHCAKVDVVISSTSSPEPIVTSSKIEEILKSRNGTPLFLIDIAVPRNIERNVSKIEGVYLYDIDDLQVIADQNLAMRQKEIAVCKQIIREHVDRYNSWFTSRLSQITESLGVKGSGKWTTDNQSGLATA